MGRGEEASWERWKMDGERKRRAEEAKRTRARGACGHGSRFFWTLHIFQCPSTAIPILPLPLSFFRLLYLPPIRYLSFLRVPRAPPPPPTRSPPSAAASTTDSFFHCVHAIAKDDDIGTFSRSSAFQKNRESEGSSGLCCLVTLQTNAVEFTQNERFYAAASSDTVTYKIFIELSIALSIDRTHLSHLLLVIVLL